MPLPRSYAAKQHKRASEFASVAQLTSVHESPGFSTQGIPSLSPPPLQLQSNGTSPGDDGLTPIEATHEGGEATAGETAGVEEGASAEVQAAEATPEGVDASGGEIPSVNPGVWNDGAAPANGSEASPGGGANPESCQIEGAVTDWTSEERADLDLGTALGPDLAGRMSPECLADTEAYARELLESESCVTSNHGRNGEITRCEGNLSYGDFPGMIEQLGTDLPTDVQRVAAYNEIADGALEQGVDNRDLNPNLVEPALPWESAKHTIVPFDDNYHGRLGGIDGDPMEAFDEAPTPSFLDSHETDWHQGLPEADSMSPGGEELSHAYSEVLRRESIPEGLGWNVDDAILYAKRVAGGSRADAEASMATIENIRDFRSGGWDAFNEGFQDRIVRPPFVRGDRQRGPGHQPRTMPGIGGVLDQLFQR